jgi:hypothetical protein
MEFFLMPFVVSLVAFLTLASAIATAEEISTRGHALGADMAGLAAPSSAPATPGHALGPDTAALRSPIGCAPDPHPASACATGEVAMDE